MNRNMTFGFAMVVVGVLIFVLIGLATCSDASVMIQEAARPSDEAPAASGAPASTTLPAPPPSGLPAPYRPDTSNAGSSESHPADATPPAAAPEAHGQHSAGSLVDPAAPVKPKGHCAPVVPGAAEGGGTEA